MSNKETSSKKTAEGGLEEVNLFLHIREYIDIYAFIGREAYGGLSKTDIATLVTSESVWPPSFEPPSVRARQLLTEDKLGKPPESKHRRKYPDTQTSHST